MLISSPVLKVGLTIRTGEVNNCLGHKDWESGAHNIKNIYYLSALCFDTSFSVLVNLLFLYDPCWILSVLSSRVTNVDNKINTFNFRMKTVSGILLVLSVN